ncbi:bacillithiol biosynthesis deacetylase BshB2 [Paenibacillus sp. Marseille-Q4541]|uniref:bacillithiol biosynthesis deacetylase BshB2 n=1 Tax=Paenibacillus sp. Marseille-Q4541 TaxID=2831522 RepID=UPI001BAB4FE4|nr:bacillithiol biosynthesis deacetylase BshB2 [Paenibacillus sp. Marseille-Q4541]
MKQNRILVVLPHPDDESFGISGTLAKLINEEGAQVTYACLTLGEMARNMGNPPIANRITLPEIRKEELKQSCRAIGIQDLRMLGFHDKTIEFEDRNLLDGSISALIEELNPSIIFTFYPGYSVHPDHDATGAAVVRVVEALEKDRRPTVLCVAFSNNHKEALGEPDVSYDIRNFKLNKVQSIQAHSSQFRILSGDSLLKDKQFQKRLETEYFWTYPVK